MAVKAKSGNYAVHHIGYMAYQVIDQRSGEVCGNFRNVSESFTYAIRLSELEKGRQLNRYLEKQEKNNG